MAAHKALETLFEPPALWVRRFRRRNGRPGILKRLVADTGPHEHGEIRNVHRLPWSIDLSGVIKVFELTEEMERRHTGGIG